ncbi:hypothetical protein D9757_015317 [Collybiopsis confluens]|uniref:Ubiquitin-like protease family profile domain-containing protein n=1 Tax=Collybiopsis confluens TaxID=2823264 RepID=A0A8H5FPV9_9AGAR|nr:hypothetical protein D9757_015317 [Collybiopsis confluens]
MHPRNPKVPKALEEDYSLTTALVFGLGSDQTNIHVSTQFIELHLFTSKYRLVSVHSYASIANFAEAKPWYREAGPAPLLRGGVPSVWSYCRCNASSFLELSALIKSCQTYLPFISFASLSMATDYSQYQLFLDRQFHLPYSDGGDVKLYVDFETHSQHLRDTAAQLSASPVMNHPFTSCEHHVALPSDSRALAVVENLRLLLRCIRTKQVSLYNDWCIALDKFPAMTERMLRSLMNEAGHVSDHKWTKVAPVSYSDFATLGVGRWLNDVVINYFVQKWCSREGTTLGLSTYFAGKFLFQGNSCTTAKTGTLTLADEERVVKSCRRTMKIRGLEFWDSVFIPINENSSHWYSAYIDFRLKRIEIYDSLQGTCLANRRKPVLLRKNANLMLVRLQIV